MTSIVTYIEKAKFIGSIRWPNNQSFDVSNIYITAGNGNRCETDEFSYEIGDISKSERTQIRALLDPDKLLRLFSLEGHLWKETTSHGRYAK